MKRFIKVILLVLLLLPLFAFAQQVPPGTITNPAQGFFVDFGSKNTFKDLIIFIIQKVLLPVVGVISMLFLIIGGFQYVTSGANQELAEAGKKTLRNAIIGLTVAILSYVLVVVILNALSKVP